MGGLIRRLEREQPGAPGDRFQFAIAPKGADDLIGDCTLKVGRGYARQAEIDFTLSRAYQGKGYATEADDRARADKLRGTCDPLDKDPEVEESTARINWSATTGSAGSASWA